MKMSLDLMSNRRLASILLFFAAIALLQLPSTIAAAAKATTTRMEGCPLYKSISAVKSNFSMSLLNGRWYVIATTEPTIPSFAKSCGILNFMVYGGGAYRYWSTSEAVIGTTRRNFTVGPIGGQIGPKLKEQGDCMENLAPFNHTISGTLVPNMFFNYSTGSKSPTSSSPEWYMSYACVARMFGENVFSFFLSARSPFVTKEWVDEKLAWVKQQGIVDLTGVVIADQQVWKQTCWNEVSKLKAQEEEGEEVGGGVSVGAGEGDDERREFPELRDTTEENIEQAK